MHFIRTAGCNVGRQLPTSDQAFPILKTGARAAQCTTIDGRNFWCDTDFFHGTATEVVSLIEETWEDHICLTGGEPLLHKDTPAFNQLCKLAFDFDKRIHIETSGTILYEPIGLWITVSPKHGCLREMIDVADEIKLLIDRNFLLKDIPDEILNHPNVFVQPINDELAVDPVNMKLAQAILEHFPHWRLSVQLHKFLGVR
jgi:organic radical activating enzyme